MKLKINTIVPEVVLIYDEDDNLVGEANEQEFNDFRIQILKTGEKGYYVLLDGHLRIEIDKLGCLKDCPSSKYPFRSGIDQITEILKLQMSKRIESRKEREEKKCPNLIKS